MLCFPLCLLYFRAPFRQQTDSAVEKNTEGISASTPLGVITNRAILGSANGIANAGAAATPGKDLSAEEARERRRSVSRAAARVLGEQLSRGSHSGGDFLLVFSASQPLLSVPKASVCRGTDRQ